MIVFIRHLRKWTKIETVHGCHDQLRHCPSLDIGHSDKNNLKPDLFVIINSH